MVKAEFCMMNRHTMLRRLQERAECGAEALTMQDFEGKLEGYLRMAVDQVLASFWHQSRRR